MLLLLGGALACQHFTPLPKKELHAAESESKLDYLNLRLNKMEKSMERLTRAIVETEKASRQGRADLSVSIEDLRNETKTLNGTLDVLQHDLKQLSQKNQKVLEDFDTRLSDLNDQVDKAATTKAAPRKRKARGGTAQYNHILSRMQKSKKYDRAILEFREFIKTNRRHSLASNAQYWIGEGYYAKGDFARAIAEYQVVVDKYPRGEKVCDALLKQGFSFGKLKATGKSKLFLEEVQDRCPRTPAAKKASARLAKLARK